MVQRNDTVVSIYDTTKKVCKKSVFLYSLKAFKENFPADLRDSKDFKDLKKRHATTVSYLNLQ